MIQKAVLVQFGIGLKQDQSSKIINFKVREQGLKLENSKFQFHFKVLYGTNPFRFY
ncbi:hypothetical protein Hanom_Chr09g00787631 [Helianthus anomalus]